jgi:hypothetical protein
MIELSLVRLSKNEGELEYVIVYFATSAATYVPI